MTGRPVIGLEIHLQLATQTKLFCACANRFGAPPNTLVCPTCLGLPGALPVLNQRAVELGVTLALALDAKVAPLMAFDRKNYFYPDLPKGYQITQFRRPLGTGGRLCGVRIERIHLEEDAGASRHGERETLLDLNRAGVPLLEIVTRPDLETPEEAVDFVRGIREIARFTAVSGADMERGNLRCEPNVNLVLSTGEASAVVEIKNLNSLGGLRAALRHEIERQRRGGGSETGRTTRGWDEARGATVAQRGKEEREDYRYFPEPDLPEIPLPPSMVAGIRRALPRLPAAWREILTDRYELKPAAARALTVDRETAVYAGVVLEVAGREAARAAANLLLTDVRRALRERGEMTVPPEAVGALARLLAAGRITRDAARREVWPRMLDEGRSPVEILAAEGLGASPDPEEVLAVVREEIGRAPAAAAAFRAGKDAALGPIVGRALARLRGGVEPRGIRDLIAAEIRRGEG